MISNFKQHFRGVTTSIVAPPVLLLAKVSARRAKYKAKVQKLSLFISEPPPNLRVGGSARRAKYELKRMAKVQGESARRAIFFSPHNHELQPHILYFSPLVHCAEYGQVFRMLILCIFAINMTIKPQNHETSFIAINSSCVLSHSIGAS